MFFLFISQGNFVTIKPIIKFKIIKIIIKIVSLLYNYELYFILLYKYKMKFFLILCFFIIIIGTLSLIYIFPNITKKNTNTKRKIKLKNETKLDKQLHKSKTQELQDTVKRSNKVKEIIQEFKQKINKKQAKSNYEQGINIEERKGLDSRVNIHVI